MERREDVETEVWKVGVEMNWCVYSSIVRHGDKCRLRISLFRPQLVYPYYA